MKTKPTHPLYQNIGVFDQQKEIQALFDAFFKNIVPNEGTNVSAIIVAAIINMLVPTDRENFLQ